MAEESTGPSNLPAKRDPRRVEPATVPCLWGARRNRPPGPALTVGRDRSVRAGAGHVYGGGRPFNGSTVPCAWRPGSFQPACSGRLCGFSARSCARVERQRIAPLGWHRPWGLGVFPYRRPATRRPPKPHRSSQPDCHPHGNPPNPEQTQQPQTATTSPGPPGHLAMRTTPCTAPGRPDPRRTSSPAPKTVEQTPETTKIPTDHEDQRDLVNRSRANSRTVVRWT